MRCNMKRFLISFLAILVVLLIVIGGVFLLKPNKTDMSFVENGKATFKYDTLDISTPLSKSDLNSIINIFNEKKLYKDNPSCGFTENVAVWFNDDTQTFCIACDMCPIIYWENKDRYFRISEDENIMLRDILRGYGFVFPCV